MTFLQAKRIADVDKVVMKVPKGTSPYQAAWLEGESDEDGPGFGSDSDEDGDTALGPLGAALVDGLRAEAAAAGGRDMVDSDASGSDNDNDLDEEAADFSDEDGDDDEEEEEEEEGAKRLRLEQENAEFPNEVDTPREGRALERFARYRGLRSFRNTPWNPKWNLPRSYARCYQFKHFKHTQRQVLKMDAAVDTALKKREMEAMLAKKLAKKANKKKVVAAGTGADAGTMDVDADMGSTDAAAAAGYVPAGKFVCIHILNVPVARLHARSKDLPLVVAGLLKCVPCAFVGGSAGVSKKGCGVLTFFVLVFSGMRTACQWCISTCLATATTSRPSSPRTCSSSRWAGARTMQAPSTRATRSAKTSTSFCASSCPTCMLLPLCLPLSHTPPTQCSCSAAIPRCVGLLCTCAACGVPWCVVSGGVAHLCDWIVIMCPSLHVPQGKRVLVASGVVMGVNPDRIVLKETMLTGYPIKVKRKTAVVKYMFFTAEDVQVSPRACCFFSCLRETRGASGMQSESRPIV